ncbi:hypothetical protein EG68_11725 [Paragonimus skrjabini miyazakii]|uniref:Uncharacterized protein n=1 Tax=Paragonimus skrjabini miyazakii TaxID=59628 RepID=A0A8S9YAL4_9TREM|nr:hypothetical protein EG68_11725 [Paragonimus skrjabini miyazakii]
MASFTFGVCPLLTELEKSELEHTRVALDTQREEISRLNGLLHKLLGINPDLTQLQTGLVELNRRVQTDSTGDGHLHNADPLRRAQSMHAGLAASFSDQRNMSRPLTPLTGLTTRAMSGQLFCNVPEHHYLEDCMEQLRQKTEHLEGLQIEQQKKLRQTVKWKKKLEKQLETFRFCNYSE